MGIDGITSGTSYEKYNNKKCIKKQKIGTRAIEMN